MQVYAQTIWFMLVYAQKDQFMHKLTTGWGEIIFTIQGPSHEVEQQLPTFWPLLDLFYLCFVEKEHNWLPNIQNNLLLLVATSPNRNT